MDFSKIKKNQFAYTALFIITAFSLTSYVISLATFTSPTRDLRWDSSVLSLNKDTFTSGEIVEISAFFEEGESFIDQGSYINFDFPENVRWNVVIYDPTLQPVYIKSGALFDQQGDITIPLSYTLSSDPVKGTYRIRLFVWTESLPPGETRTRTVNEKTFEVV